MCTCKKSRKKGTTETFKTEVNALTGDEYSVLEEYKSALTPIRMRHNLCGYEWSVRPCDFKRRPCCPKCSTKTKKNMTEIFKVKVAKLVGNEYTVLGEYKNSVTPILMRHNTCGHEWSVRPGLFKHGTRCPICNKGGRKKKPQTAI